MDRNGHIMMTDFNICVNLREVKPSSRSGTMPYLAPEMFGGKPYGPSVDFWALGILLFECTYGHRPFDTNQNWTYETFQQFPLIFPPKFYHTTVEIAQCLPREMFYSSLLQVDCKLRMGTVEAGLGFEDNKLHPWLSTIDWNKVKERKQVPPYQPDVL